MKRKAHGKMAHFLGTILKRKVLAMGFSDNMESFKTSEVRTSSEHLHTCISAIWLGFL